MKLLVCVRLEHQEEIPTFEEYGIIKAAKQALENRGSINIIFKSNEEDDLIAKVEVTRCEHIDMGLVNYVASKSEEYTFFYKYYCLDEKELEAI